MKIIKIYSGFFFKDFYFKYDEENSEKLNIWDLIIFKSWFNTYRWKVKNTFKDWECRKNSEDFSFIRKCSDEDLKEIEEQKEKEKEYLKYFSENYQQFKIKLEPNTSELSFDDKMLLFSYTSEERIDFRELVKFLAWKFRRRIQLKHLWARDKAAAFWWYWVCWRELCCSKFLKNIPVVPIHAPKVQDLMYKDMDNLLWVCGKLKCCLNYEVQQYQDIKKNMPNIWTSVFIDWKKWIIIWVDIFSQKVKIKTSDFAKIYDLDEIKEFLEKKNEQKPEIKTFNKNKNFNSFEKKPFQKFPKKDFKDLKKNNHHVNFKEKNKKEDHKKQHEKINHEKIKHENNFKK